MDPSRSQSGPRSLYIPDRGESLFAFFHEAQGNTRELAVVLCPPFGEEDMSSYRGRREWASSLAGAGIAALRIDFPGSGDSSGAPRDPDRLRAWTDAVGTSARWLSETTHARRIVAIGIGLGGVIAYRALALGAPIDDLVLWGVSARGSKHLRELRAFAHMAGPAVEADATTPVALEEPADGSLAVSGYVLSADTQRELNELDLAQLDRRLDCARVLLLERDGRAVDSRLKDAIERNGAQVTVAPGDGYAAMMMAGLPHSVSAYGVFETVNTWLARNSAAEESTAPGAATPPNGHTPSGTDSAEITMPDGKRIRETPIRIPRPAGDLFGILAEPLDAPVSLCAIWLNAGPVRRIGPNRMWVETARRWAVLGVPTFRVDLAAIGDAEGDARELLDVESYYTAEYLQQVRLVLDTLQARGLPARFLLGGLCAGGYWALRVAQEDTRVSAAVALNPGYLVYDGGLSKAVGHGRSLLSMMLKRSTWARVMRGQITPSAHFAIMRTLLTAFGRTLLSLPSRALARNADAGGNEVAQAFDRLRDQDQSALVLFVGEERLHERMLASGKLSGLERWPNVSVEHIEVPGDVHTLRPLSLQREAHRRVDELLQRELELIAGEPLVQH